MCDPGRCVAADRWPVWDVELVRGGEVTAYRAVPDDSAAAVETVTRLMGKGSGARYWVGRTVLLWAPIKPVRLEPRKAGDA